MSPSNEVPSARELGAFYTPASTAASIASWVIRSGRERLLEPSFGGGSLIEAALNRSQALLGKCDLDVLGFDIDPAACAAVRPAFAGNNVSLIRSDFLAAKTDDYEPFDAVVSNPPFTRNHAIPRDRRGELRARFRTAGASGLWVYFLLHSMTFLKKGGRIACLVPRSAFFTGYGTTLIDRLCAEFSSVELLRLNERPKWVGVASEEGALILAEGYQLGSCIAAHKGFWVDGRGAVADFLERPSGCFAELMLGSQNLGAVADLSIGSVTGCNRVFLLSEAERTELEIPLADVTPVASRARQLEGLILTKADLKLLAKRGEKTWLLTPRTLEFRGSGARRRLKNVTLAERRRTVWFRKRHPWWRVDTGSPADAVFSYMNDHGPKIVRTTPGITCTNTLHRVRYHQVTSERQKIASMVTLVSTFGQLAAERMGRVYGGGVLKFELGDARQLPVCPLAAKANDVVIFEIDELLRARRFDAARDLADQAVLPSICGDSWMTAAKELQSELNERRRARRERKVD